MFFKPPTAIVFDLGDVFFSWSGKTGAVIPPRTLKDIVSSSTWYAYECGKYNQDECYQRIAEEFSLLPADINAAFQQARKSLTTEKRLSSLIRDLKAQTNDSLKIYGMSNISRPDYEYLRSTSLADWSIFDQIFPSWAAGERKPNLAFYMHVIQETGLDPHSVVFIDDKIDNVLSARSLGFQGIVFDNFDNLSRQLQNICGTPEKRGLNFLRRNAGKLHSVTDDGLVIQDNFAELLILEATGDRSLTHISEPPRTWNFFRGKAVLTSEFYPDDFDTTALGLTITKNCHKEVLHSIMDEMLEYRNGDGIILTYFDRERPRLDPCVCVNVLSLFYQNGRGSELRQTLDWVYQVLLHRAYIDGTRYYTSGDCFLFFIGRLLSICKDCDLHNRLMPLFQERVQERVGTGGDALALAMRIVACAAAGVKNHIDMRTLLSLQCDDGGWEIGWAYRIVGAKARIGSRGLTTAISLRAIAESSLVYEAQKLPNWYNVLGCSCNVPHSKFQVGCFIESKAHFLVA